jgi:hypothetical protein
VKLEVVSEFVTGFGKRFEVLSCGHSRRAEADDAPDRTSGADGDLPEEVVYCWHGCHESKVS